jgi:signal transduction histidine kinase/hemoglobin-like flavoprotein
VKKRGVNFWAKMKIKFLEPIQPDGPSFKVILQDATHRALSKERIRTLKDEYLAIFNNPFVGTFKFKMDGFFVQMCNQKTLEIFHKQNSNELRLDQVFASSQQLELFTESLRKEKKVEGFKFKIKDQKNHENWAIISARYFENQGFAEGVVFDVTDQYTQMMELQRVNNELDNFIYHASHDLRSPLTSIMGLVNLGIKENNATTVQNYLTMIKGRIDHLDVLLKDLIAVSYNNSTGNESTPFQFEPEVKSILSLLKNPGHAFSTSVVVSQPCEFQTDPIRMRTILRNLLSNAFKYYNPDLPVSSIQLNIRVLSTHCAIFLRDNGIGIHPSYKSRVYDMFFRATDRSAGSGLGLYIVKSMVEKLMGKISFESSLNIGTTFLLTIPNQGPSVLLDVTNPIDYFMLTTKQIELVEKSWDFVLLNSSEAGVIFYNKLFSVEPSLRQVFNGDFSSESQKFITLITFTVHKLSNVEEIISEIKAQEFQGKMKLIQPQHYESAAAALMQTLEEILVNMWNDEVKEAWNAVYVCLAKAMAEAVEG